MTLNQNSAEKVDRPLENSTMAQVTDSYIEAIQNAR